MDFKYIKPIKIIAYILTALFLIGAIWFGWNNRQIKINHLQHTVNILFAYKLNEPALREQIVKLEKDNAKLQQQLDNLNIHYEADEKYIGVLEGRYLRCEIYANTAELILRNNGIDFVRIND